MRVFGGRTKISKPRNGGTERGERRRRFWQFRQAKKKMPEVNFPHVMFKKRKQAVKERRNISSHSSHLITSSKTFKQPVPVFRLGKNTKSIWFSDGDASGKRRRRVRRLLLPRLQMTTWFTRSHRRRDFSRITPLLYLGNWQVTRAHKCFQFFKMKGQECKGIWTAQAFAIFKEKSHHY